MEFADLDLYGWMNSWLRLLEEYTSRDFSKTTDQLPALHGLMAAITKRAGGEFYAGTWSIHLAEQLLWMPISQDIMTDMETDYAPSWSWASLSALSCARLLP